VLDPLLQDAAVAAGADLRDQTKVVGLLRDGDRVVGVEAETRGGGKHAFRAQVVVGADGRHSTIAKLTGAKEYYGYDNVRFGYWGYWPANRAWRHDQELAGIDALISFGHDRSTRFVFQTDGDLLLLGVTPPMSELDAWSGDFEAAYVRSLQALPQTAKLVEGNRREGKLVGLKKLRFFFREAAGPGFALVGDAGLHKDPSPGIGITDALRDSRNLARAILEGGDRALRRYHRQRDVDSFDLFHFAKHMGEPEYINPLNRLVYQRVRQRPDLLARISKSTDREISPLTAVPTRDVIGWMASALLRGDFSVVSPFLATGKRNGELETQRREVFAALSAV
jgi:flavin-dependent dehydrogenase